MEKCSNSFYRDYVHRDYTYMCVYVYMGFPGGSVVKNLPANAGDTGLIPTSGRSLGEGNGSPLQYSCLEISVDGGEGQLQRVRHD